MTPIINNAATTSLLLQNSINSANYHNKTPMTNSEVMFMGIPLIAILLVLSIGFVADCFGLEKVFDFCMKATSILSLVAVLGLIVSIFVH